MISSDISLGWEFIVSSTWNGVSFNGFPTESLDSFIYYRWIYKSESATAHSFIWLDGLHNYECTGLRLPKNSSLEKQERSLFRVKFAFHRQEEGRPLSELRCLNSHVSCSSLNDVAIGLVILIEVHSGLLCRRSRKSQVQVSGGIRLASSCASAAAHCQWQGRTDWSSVGTWTRSCAAATASVGDLTVIFRTASAPTRIISRKPDFATSLPLLRTQLHHVLNICRSISMAFMTKCPRCAAPEKNQILNFGRLATWRRDCESPWRFVSTLLVARVLSCNRLVHRMLSYSCTRKCYWHTFIDHIVHHLSWHQVDSSANSVIHEIRTRSS